LFTLTRPERLNTITGMMGRELCGFFDGLRNDYGACIVVMRDAGRATGRPVMAHAFDLIVRGSTVVNGTGGEPFEADIAVKDGKIARIGTVSGSAAEEIDAKGLLVTPGFVDIHTHYDGQAICDAPAAGPSSVLL
jgi:urease alpha subunit